MEIVLKKAEQLARLAADLQKSNKELEAFSYSISHDLRAPFRHIVGFSQLLTQREKNLGERSRHYLQMISDSALAAGELVDDLLTFSHLGRAAISADRVDMNKLVAEVRLGLAEETVGRSVRDYFGEYEYRHHKSGRLVKEEIFPMHYLAFPEGCVHAENVGGDIEKVLNTRCIIGAFPWKFEGGEACPCRILAFLDVGPLTVDEVREAVGKKSG